MKVFEILNESSELEQLQSQLSKELSDYQKIDHPTRAEQDEHNTFVSKLKSKIDKLKAPTSAKPNKDVKSEIKQKSLTTAQNNLKKAEVGLANAKTEREKKTWRTNLALAKHDLEKASK